MDKVTAAVVDCYADVLDAFLAEHDADLRPLLRDATERTIADRLRLVITRVFVVEFHRFRRAQGLPADPGSTVAIDRYLAGFDAGTIGAWRDTYPVFGPLLDRIAHAVVAHLRRVVERLTADRALLAARSVLSAEARLIGIDPLDSDPHRGGQTVALLRFDDGTRLVYKPRSLAPEIFAATCLGIVSRAGEDDLSRCVPASLDRGEYGWQEFVVPAELTGEQAADRYYRTFGALAAVLTALGASDLHHENLIAAGDRPVVVDLETVLHADFLQASDGLPDAVNNRLRRSMATTMLLPQRMPSGPYSVLTGGVGVGDLQDSERTDFMLVNQDTDGIDIARRTYPYQHGSNVPRSAQGEAQDLLAHRDAFVAGMRAGIDALVATRADLIRVIDEARIEVRQIMRGTANYVRILAAATHPDNMRDEAQFLRVLGALHPPAGLRSAQTARFVQDAELQALLQGDVPYFTVEANDVRIRAAESSSGPTFDAAPREWAKRSVLQVDAGPWTDFEEQVIEEGLAELRDLRLRTTPTYRSRDIGPFGAAITDDGIDWRTALDRLRAVAVRTTGIDGPEMGWITGAYTPTMATFDPGTAVSFHDAGGLAVLFDRAPEAAPEQAETLRAEGAAVRRGLSTLVRRYREGLMSAGSSIVSGPASLEYVLRPGATRNEPIEAALAEAVSSADRELAGDLLLGPPGLSLVLADLPDTPESVLARALEAIPVLPTGGKGPWDLAHGSLGLTWAQSRLARRLGDEARLDALSDALARTAEGICGTVPPGWCIGAAGTAMVLAEISSGAAGEAVERLVDCATAALPAGEPVDLSVCHGAAGIVQSLIRVAQLTGDRSMIDRAASYWRRTARHARQYGYATGVPSRRSLLGYFLGWAGVTDTALMLDRAVLGEQVWVPLAFVRDTSRSAA